MKTATPTTDDVTAVLDKAGKELAKLLAMLTPVLVLLTGAQRSTTTRVRKGFAAAGLTFATNLREQPALVTGASGFDGDTVIGLLDKVKLLAPLIAQLEGLDQRLTDTVLAWLAEAWKPTSDAYHIAKRTARSNDDASLEMAIEPMAALYRRKAKMTPTEKTERKIALQKAKQTARAKATLAKLGVTTP